MRDLRNYNLWTRNGGIFSEDEATFRFSYRSTISGTPNSSNPENSEKARQEIRTDSHAALTTYTSLRELSVELGSRNEKAWGSMIHLTEYVEASTRQLWEEMEQILSVYRPNGFIYADI